MSFLKAFYDGLAARSSSSLDSPAKIASGDISNGDVNILTIKAFSKDGTRSEDYKKHVTEFHIYESIVSPVVYCVLHIKDDSNLAEKFRLAEDDFVQIEFQTPGADVSEYMFQVRKAEMNKRKIPSLALEVYDIELISVEGYAAQRTSMSNFDISGTAGKVIKRVIRDKIETLDAVKISRSLMKVKPAYKIDDGNGVIGKDPQSLTVEPSSGINDKITTPFQVIHKMSKLVDKSPDGHYLYTFFERRDGFYFKPIEWLMKEGKKRINRNTTDKIFYYDHLRNQSFSSVKFRNILAYSILNSGDGTSITNTTARTSNPSTGEVSTTAKADVDENLTKLTSAQALKPHNAAVEQRLVTSDAHTHLNNVMVKRQQYLSRIGQYEAQIMIYGDTNMSVGDVIECNFPQSMSTTASSTDKNQKDNLSKDAAPYLITHLRHIVLNTSRPQHAITCNLMRAETIDKK